MKKTMKWITLTAASALVGLTLMACVPSDLDKAREKLAVEGYKVTTMEGGVLMSGCVGGIRAIKEEVDDGATEADNIVAYLFDSKKAAKDFYEINKAMMDATGNGGSLVRDGKWVYMGTADAIEDFKD